MSEPLLKVENLKMHFPIKGGLFGRTVNYVKAVDDISFSVQEGETVSIVGESGCGKSTTGRAILRLEEPTSGRIEFDGNNLLSLSKKELRKKRKDMQIIFQDPYASLNPRQTVSRILEEALDIQNIVPKDQGKKGHWSYWKLLELPVIRRTAIPTNLVVVKGSGLALPGH